MLSGEPGEESNQCFSKIIVSDREPSSHLLMSPARIERVITRIAYQVYEDTRGSDKLLILGVDDRGFRLALMLAARLSEICKTTISAHPIPVKQAAPQDAKDTEPGKKRQQDHNGPELPPVGGKKVIIVDDVMYSGKTMYKALQTVSAKEHPEEIRLAALIDRGHRRYPLSVQYLGLHCPTKLQEHVRFRFTSDDKPEGVWLLTSPGHTS